MNVYIGVSEEYTPSVCCFERWCLCTNLYDVKSRKTISVLFTCARVEDLNFSAPFSCVLSVSDGRVTDELASIWKEVALLED